MLWIYIVIIVIVVLLILYFIFYNKPKKQTTQLYKDDKLISDNSIIVSNYPKTNYYFITDDNKKIELKANDIYETKTMYEKTINYRPINYRYNIISNDNNDEFVFLDLKTNESMTFTKFDSYIDYLFYNSENNCYIILNELNIDETIKITYLNSFLNTNNLTHNVAIIIDNNNEFNSLTSFIFIKSTSIIDYKNIEQYDILNQSYSAALIRLLLNFGLKYIDSSILYITTLINVKDKQELQFIPLLIKFQDKNNDIDINIKEIIFNNIVKNKNIDVENIIVDDEKLTEVNKNIILNKLKDFNNLNMYLTNSDESIESYVDDFINKYNSSIY